eukprot:scaffold7092_cov262-Pinguiococcus_pyrenoidosus.AAC.43
MRRQIDRFGQNLPRVVRKNAQLTPTRDAVVAELESGEPQRRQLAPAGLDVQWLHILIQLAQHDVAGHPRIRPIAPAKLASAFRCRSQHQGHTHHFSPHRAGARHSQQTRQFGEAGRPGERLGGGVSRKAPSLKGRTLQRPRDRRTRFGALRSVAPERDRWSLSVASSPSARIEGKKATK